MTGLPGSEKAADVRCGRRGRTQLVAGSVATAGARSTACHPGEAALDGCHGRGQLQRTVPSQHLEIAVGMQDRQTGTDGDGADETVDQLSDISPRRRQLRLEGCGILVVGGHHLDD